MFFSWWVTSDADLTRRFVLSLFAELFDLASVLAGVLELGLPDGQGDVALVVDLHQVVGVGRLDLHTVLVPLDASVGVVHFAFQLNWLLRLPVLLQIKLLFESVLWIRS